MLIWIVWSIVTLGVMQKYSSSIDVNILIGLFSLYISRPRCKNIYKIANSVTVITHVQY